MACRVACLIETRHLPACSLQGELMRLELNNTQLAQSKEELEAQKGRLSDDTQQLSAAKHGIAKVGDARRVYHPRPWFMPTRNILEDLPAAAGWVSIAQFSLADNFPILSALWPEALLISTHAVLLLYCQAYDDLRLQLDQERAAHIEQAEQQRQSFAAERSALSKRYQVTAKEAGAKHEAEVKKLRRKLKAAEASIAQLSDEMTELRLR